MSLLTITTAIHIKLRREIDKKSTHIHILSGLVKVLCNAFMFLG